MNTKKIISFYSYKGGVGRSQMLVNVASYLAHYFDKKILLIDWDLEAPGLHNFWGKDNLNGQKGVIDLFYEYRETLKKAFKKSDQNIQQFDKSFVINLLQSRHATGKIDLVPAGSYDDFYYDKVNNFNWSEFYERFDGKTYIEFLKNSLKNSEYDYIFIDSRTGINDYSGICNIHLPDVNVVIIAPSDQNIRGSHAVIQKITNNLYRNNNGTNIVIPILSRIDTSDSEGYNERFKHYESVFYEHITELIKKLSRANNRFIFRNPAHFIEETLLQYTVDISYRETNLFLKGKKVFSPGSFEEKVENMGLLLLLEGFSLENYSDEKSFIDALPRDLNFIPRAPKIFFGREKELAQLETILEKGKMVNLVGLGGIGKTSLIRTYLGKHYPQYDHIVWVNASLYKEGEGNINKSSVVSSMANDIVLFKNLGLEYDPEKDEDTRYKLVLNKLKKISGRNIMIVDDADESIEQQIGYFPQTENWKMIITSRTRLEPILNIVELREIKKKVAVKLFLQYHPDGKDYRETIEELVEFVGFHTLTIEILARTCENSLTLSPQKVLKRLKEKDLDQIMGKVWTEYSGKKTDIVSSLMNAFELAELDAKEEKLLKWFSVLPSTDIKWQALINVFGTKEEEEDLLAEDILQLSQKGWVLYNPKDKTIKCPRMIQQVLRFQLKPQIESCRNIVHNLISLLNANDSLSHFKENIIYLTFGEELLSTLEGIDIDLLALRIAISSSYQFLGRYNEAENILSVNTDALNEIFEAHPDIYVKFNAQLGSIYRELGKYEEALVIFASLLDFEKKRTSISKETLAEIQSSIAHVLRNLGKYKRAKAYLQQAFQLSLKGKGEDDIQTIRTKSNLGVLYMDLGEFDDASRYLKETHDKFIQILGENHPLTAEGRTHLASVYLKLSQFDEAKELLTVALDSDLKNFDDSHPKVAQQKTNLAKAFIASGSFLEGKSLLEDALKANKKTYGDAHPYVARVLSDLAFIDVELRSFNSARKQTEKALKINLQNFGESHPYVARCMTDLGKIFFHLNQPKNSISHIEVAIESNIKNFGKKHHYVARSQMELAKVLFELSKFEESHKLLNESLNINDELLGEVYPDNAEILRYLGRICVRQNDRMAARSYFLRAMEIFEKTANIVHPDYGENLKLLWEFSPASTQADDRELILSRTQKLAEIESVRQKEWFQNYCLILINYFQGKNDLKRVSELSNWISLP